jgi:maltooligosyltrehalose trehalohydrolase
LADETFAAAKLAWEELHRDPHAFWLAFYRHILQVRRAEIVPRLARMRAGTYGVVGAGAVTVRWPLDGLDDALCLRANLSATPVAGLPASGRVIWQEGEAGSVLGAWSVQWSWDRP